MPQYHFVYHKPTWRGLGSNPTLLASSWQLTASNVAKEFGFRARGMLRSDCPINISVFLGIKCRLTERFSLQTEVFRDVTRIYYYYYYYYY